MTTEKFHYKNREIQWCTRILSRNSNLNYILALSHKRNNNNRKPRGTNTAEPINFRKNDPTKVNNNDKPREKVSQSSNNSMGPQCFGCQGYGHMKSECPT